MNSLIPKIDIRPDHWEIVRDILHKHVPDYEVWAFGSRAKWTAKNYSDLDLAVITAKPLSLDVSANLRDDFSESDLPWKVDIVDWAATQDHFREIIKRDKVVVQKAKGLVMKSEVTVESLALYINRGITPKYTETTDDSIIVLNQKCIRDFKVSFEPSRRNDLNKRKITEGKRLKKHDVLINSTGVGTLGRVAQYFGADDDATVDSHVTIVRPNSELVDPIYFGYLMKSKQSVIESFAEGTTGQTELNRNSIKELLVEIVDNISVQKIIGGILLEIDQKLVLNTQTNQTLEQIAQAIFKSWFVDFDPVKAKIETLAAGGSADDAELAAMSVISAKTLNELNSLKANNPEAFNKLAQTAALFPSAMQDSELGEIPEGWEAGTVGSVTTAKGGYAFKSKQFIESGNPVIKIKNITSSGTVNTLDCQCVDDDVANTASSFKLSNGDLLMAMTGATVGKSGIYVSDGRDAYLNQRVACFESKIDRSAPCWFTYNLVTKDSIFEQIVGAAQGSAQPNISSKGIEQVKAVIPTHDLISKYQELVSPLYAKWISNFKENSQLSELRDTLLPKLLSGKIDLTSEVVA